MSVQRIPPASQVSPEEARERATTLLDMQLDLLCHLIGPIGMQALVAGRVLRAQLKFQGQVS